MARQWLDGLSCLGELLALSVAMIAAMVAAEEWRQRHPNKKGRK
jgi:hypothetical protein